MDKKLLDALNNLSDALQEIADALKDRGDERKSATTTAMQSGDFGNDLKSISEGIKSIKKDTQEILRQQKTISSISKEKEDDKKMGLFERAGGDKKSESNLKKGVGAILLIALAVLAIGFAFKIVGKIDFLSVIGLSIALLLISETFVNIGWAIRKMSLRDIARVALTMVVISVAMVASSYILALTKPVPILAAITAILIGAMFAILGEKLIPIFTATAVFRRTGVKARHLMAMMVGIAAAITASSYILAYTKPIGFPQAITAILIAGVFLVISLKFERIALAAVAFKRFGVSKMDLVLTMVAISTAIMASSWVLSLTNPISFPQAITAILIAAMFLIISLKLEKIAMGVVAFKRFRIKATDLLLVLVGISAAIMVSSWILSMVQPLTIPIFLTTLGIALIFALMSYIMPEMAAGIVAMDRMIGSKKMLAVVPLIFVAISLAIMLSSHILSMSADMDFMRMLKIAVFGVVLGVAILAMVPSVLLVGIAAASGVGAGAILLGALMIPVIATAIALSSHILSTGKYVNYPKLSWALGVGASIVGFGLAAIELGAVALTGVGAAALLLGTGFTLLIAKSIVETSYIISRGKYDKYPGLGWIASVGFTMTAFGAAIVGLGVLSISGLGLGALAILMGTKWIPAVAKSIVQTDQIISRGKYNKYPGLGWIASVVSIMATFGAGIVALGVLSISGLGLGALAILMGTKWIPAIARSIVQTDKIIARGKYNKYPGLGWIASVVSIMATFGAGIVALGVLSISGLGLGALAILMGTKWIPTVAWSIVQTDKIIRKGKYDKYPGLGWALSVGGLMTAFGAAIIGLGALALTGIGALAIFAGAKLVKLVAQSVVDAAWIFKNASGAFEGSYPKKEWAEGVGLALGAFAPVYKMLMKGGVMALFQGSGPNAVEYATAITTISQGIVDAAWFFQGASVAFVGGPKKEWSEGVGKAIGAFAPVFKMLSEDTGWFTSGEEVVGMMGYAIRSISYSIIASARIFSKSGVSFGEGTYPKKEWASGVGGAIKAFAPVFKSLSKDTGWFTSGQEVVDALSYGIRSIAYAIVRVGKAFEWSKLNWTGTPNKEWNTNVMMTTKNFLKMYEMFRDNDVNSTYMYPMISMARNLSAMARVFWKNSKFFETTINPDYMQAINKNLSLYMKLSGSLKSNTSFLDRVLKNPTIMMAESFSKFAKILYLNRRYFQEGMDPNFMKNMSGNINYYLALVNRLGAQNSLKSLTKSALFGDPISNLASGMVKLARAYTKMAEALVKFNAAVKGIDDKKVKSFKNINKMIAPKEEGFLSKVGTGIGNAISALPALAMPGLTLASGAMNMLGNMFGKKKEAPAKVEKGKHGNASEQMDKIIELLTQLTANTGMLNEYIDDRMGSE